MRILDRINRTGTTVVMATHDHAIVDAMQRRVVQLDRGRIIRDESRGVYETATQEALQPPPAAAAVEAAAVSAIGEVSSVTGEATAMALTASDDAAPTVAEEDTAATEKADPIPEADIGDSGDGPSEDVVPEPDDESAEAAPSPDEEVEG
jgi:energy-coupling factor transporter ATP-binding protein EcfA2